MACGTINHSIEDKTASFFEIEAQDPEVRKSFHEPPFLSCRTPELLGACTQAGGLSDMVVAVHHEVHKLKGMSSDLHLVEVRFAA